jgi:hypothetical protein
MKKIAAIPALLIFIFVVVAASGCIKIPSNINTNANTINENSTKLALYNNGNTWAQVELVANVTNKDGENITIYSDTFTKPSPNGNITIDLSQLLGYGNEKLPAGTTIRVLSWKGLFNNTNIGGTGTLNITMQGWSNTLKPGADDEKVNITFTPLTIYKLPSNITDNTIFLVNNPKDLSKISFYDSSDQEILFEEELITVDSNGKVTIRVTTPPELCSAISSIV